MALTDNTRPTDVALNTDLYEFTMAQGFWDSQKAQAEGCFNVFFRSIPFHNGYAVACGMGQIADLVENFSYDEETIDYLASLKAPGGGSLFTPDFLNYLRHFSLDVDIWAVPEGEIVFPREPLVRVQGKLIDCQLLETALLNTVNFQTLLATKTARVVRAAQGRPIFEFGLRRAQGPDGGLAAARASYVGGAAATSNVLAGKIYDIPVFGTHAHSWVMAFPSQIDAFRAFAESSPHNCVFLIDTYDVESGIADAIFVGKEMERKGQRLAAVRIDSGDLAKLSMQARRAFDEAGMPYVKISVSNDLDEYTIQSLLAQHAPIDSFGVGTKLATCDPQPALGGVYKMTAIKNTAASAWQPVMKLSEMAYKRTIPGIQTVMRYVDANNSPTGDMIVEEAKVHEKPAHMVDVLDDLITYDIANCSRHELLEHIVSHGKRTRDPQSLPSARERCKNALDLLDPAYCRFLNPQSYPVGLEPSLANVRRDLASRELQMARGADAGVDGAGSEVSSADSTDSAASSTDSAASSTDSAASTHFPQASITPNQAGAQRRR